MSDDERKARIDRYIDGWMEKLDARVKEYRAQGLTADGALEVALIDIRRQIRTSPPVDLDHD